MWISHIEIYSKNFRVGYRTNFPVIQLHVSSCFHGWYKWLQLSNLAYAQQGCAQVRAHITLTSKTAVLSMWVCFKQLGVILAKISCCGVKTTSFDISIMFTQNNLTKNWRRTLSEWLLLIRIHAFLSILCFHVTSSKI